MKIHLLTGFLGSGKTTAIQHASRIMLRKGVRTGAITNDQGNKLVDGDFFKTQDLPSREVVNGCFCCNYNDLDDRIQSLVETDNTDVIFAESVGSCGLVNYKTRDLLLNSNLSQPALLIFVFVQQFFPKLI